MIKKRAKSCGKFLRVEKPITGSSLEYRDRLFYVVFTDAEHMLSPLLKKGFAHCYVIEKLEYLYMMFDPTRHGMNVVLPNCDTEHPLVENMKGLDPALTILKLRTCGNEDALVFAPKILTCVSTLEYIMGISFGSFKAITPYGLYKQLMKAEHPNILRIETL